MQEKNNVAHIKITLCQGKSVNNPTHFTTLLHGYPLKLKQSFN